MRKNNIKVNDAFVIFFYDIFEEANIYLKDKGIKIHYLCTWKDILKEIKKERILENSNIIKLEKFLFEKK